MEVTRRRREAAEVRQRTREDAEHLRASKSKGEPSRITAATSTSELSVGIILILYSFKRLTSFLCCVQSQRTTSETEMLTPEKDTQQPDSMFDSPIPSVRLFPT